MICEKRIISQVDPFERSAKAKRLNGKRSDEESQSEQSSQGDASHKALAKVSKNLTLDSNLYRFQGLEF